MSIFARQFGSEAMLRYGYGNNHYHKFLYIEHIYNMTYRRIYTVHVHNKININIMIKLNYDQLLS